MGAGASAKVATAVGQCSPDDLRAFCQALPKDEWDKVQCALEKSGVRNAVPFDREALLNKIFVETDANNDGALSVEEFKKLAASQSDVSLSMQEAVFAMVDENADGKLALQEFVKFNLESGTSLNDADFKMQAEQWLMLAKVRAPPLDRPALLSRIFEETDSNKDGWLSMEEFKNLAASQSNMALTMQEAVFSLVDENSDGKLAPEEFLKFNLEGGSGLSDADFRKQAEQWLRLAEARNASSTAADTAVATVLAAEASAPAAES